MKFTPLNDDIEYLGIDVTNNNIIAKKIYYKKNTGRKNVFDSRMSGFEKKGVIKLFDYSMDKEKESFGYLIYKKNVSSLFTKEAFSSFFSNNSLYITFIDEISNHTSCYPPVLGIKYIKKKVSAMGIYSNPPFDKNDYIEHYEFIRDRFLKLYPSYDYIKLLLFIDELIYNNYSYLFLFGFDATLMGSKKMKFYIKIQSIECINLIMNHISTQYNFDIKFLKKVFYEIPAVNNTHVDIIAFSFLEKVDMLAIQYIASS